MIDIIIIAYNSRQLTVNCIESIIKTSLASNIKIIVVDNNSNDDTVEYINNNYKNITVIANEKNLGYAKAVNIGVANASSEYVLISNNDVIFTENSIELLFNFSKSNEMCAVVSPQQLYPNGAWQASYGNFPGFILGVKCFFLITLLANILNRKLYKIKNGKKPKKVQYADGAVMFIKKKHFNQIGGFDEDYFFYTEETDFCKRIENIGLCVYHMPEAIVYHIRGGSESANRFSLKTQKMLVDSKLLFCKKHCSRIETNAYIFFEKCHHKVMLAFWKIRKLLKGNERNSFKVNYYLIMLQVWNEIMFI